MESTRWIGMNNGQVDDSETSIWKLGSNNAWIWITKHHHSVFRPDGKPPLPTLLTLEPYITSTDRSDEELQFEEIRLTWLTAHLTINPLNRRVQRIQKCRTIILSTFQSMKDRRIPDDIGSSANECGTQLTSQMKTDKLPNLQAH